MADGYAQASGRPAFLNLHTSAGLGNAIGNLTNAVANGSPLVVTAGQQDWRHIVTDPLLSGDLTGLARPVAKWVHEVRSVDELGTILRRAFHDAASPPAGPVFVSLPMSMLDTEGDLSVPAPSQIDRRAVPSNLGALADLLVDTPVGSLAIVAGDEVAASGGVGELVELAEALGAPVFGAALHSTGVFPPTHPLYAGMLAPAAAAINAALGPFRRVLAVGGHTFMVYPYTPGSALPETVELLHVSPDASRLGRTYPTRLGMVGDPKATLAALLPMVRRAVDAAEVAVAVAAADAKRRQEIDAARGDRPVSLRERTDGPDGGGARVGPRSPPEHHGGRRGDHDRLLRAAASITGPSRVTTSSARAEGWAGGCRGARRLARPRPRARALRRRRRFRDVLPAGALDSGARAAARRVRGREQPAVPHPQGLSARHGPRQCQGRSHGGDGHRRAAGRLRRSRSLDGRRRDARREGRRRRRRRVVSNRRRDALICSSCPSLHRDRRDGAVDLRGVSVVYDGKLVLDDLDWRVQAGERWVVLGPNGSGKTTLVRIVSLYLHPTRGDVCVLGAVLGKVDIRKVRPRIGLASASLAAMLRPRSRWSTS